ncbi:MAG: prolipoprotein diacylglyceryl transferase [Butyricicoccus sp.]
MEHVIAFPGLGLEFTLNRVAVNILGKDIYWYGIIICVGFIIAALYGSRKTIQFGYTKDHLYDLMLLCVPIAIVCARLYYVIFQWNDYKNNPAEIIMIWHGGLAIYGGILGAVATICVYGKYHHLNIPGMLDVAASGIIIGQIFGRWGNFVNAEAFGGPTDLPWSMVIDGAAPVHPTFFYESLWNLIGFLILHQCCKRRHFRGEIFLIYAAWYGFGRFWIESLRADSLYIPGTPLRVSQVLAGVSCIAAIVLLVLGRKNKVETLGQIWCPVALEKPIHPDKKENDQ